MISSRLQLALMEIYRTYQRHSKPNRQQTPTKPADDNPTHPLDDPALARTLGQVDLSGRVSELGHRCRGDEDGQRALDAHEGGGNVAGGDVVEDPGTEEVSPERVHVLVEA
jgi:hypothetical protein